LRKKPLKNLRSLTRMGMSLNRKTSKQKFKRIKEQLRVKYCTLPTSLPLKMKMKLPLKTLIQMMKALMTSGSI